MGGRRQRHKKQNNPLPGEQKVDRLARLLVVDKFPLVRAGVRYELAGSGLASVVGEAGDGKEAVELTGKLKPDVVILGIGLPVLNGLEATARIRRNHPESRVIVHSRFDGEEYVWAALRNGAAGYLLKRAALTELTEAVARVQRGETYLSAELAKDLFRKFCNGSFPETECALDKLTDRQCQILQLIAEGHNTKQIGDILGLSPKTVDFHRVKLMAKLGLRTIPDLVRFALHEKLIDAE